MTALAVNSLDAWNAAPRLKAIEALLSCCGSTAWANTLAEHRPYATPTALLQDAEATWFAQPESEWLIAFACHPRIGERKADIATTASFAHSSTSEQSAAQATLTAVADALAQGNQAYETRFGFLYIVFASGRTAPELLALLTQRLTHDRPTELAEAARQQWLITKLRMDRWLA